MKEGFKLYLNMYKSQKGCFLLSGTTMRVFLFMRVYVRACVCVCVCLNFIWGDDNKRRFFIILSTFLFIYIIANF